MGLGFPPIDGTQKNLPQFPLSPRGVVFGGIAPDVGGSPANFI